MTARTQPFSQLPWTGGVNTAVDSGLIPANDVQLAENVLFSDNGARIKREGMEYWDATSDVPAVSSGSSSGTIRTLVFASTLTPASIQKLVPGELIVVTSTDTKYLETSVAVASLNGDTISYLATSGTHSSAASATVTVTRASPIVHVKDYWRFTGSANTQSIVAMTSQPLLFKYDSSARRTQILPNLTASAQTVTHRSSSTTTRSLKFGATITGIVANDRVRITSTATAEAPYVNIEATVLSITTTTNPDDTLNYTMPTSVTESSTATTSITVSEWTTATPRAGTAVKQNSVVFNEALIVFQSRIGNLPILYAPNSDADWFNLDTAPDLSAGAVHLNRVWGLDKEVPDRLHYSATGNAQKWEGADDSGYLEVRPGDGDPVGLQSVWEFKGRLFVGKKHKMYQIVGNAPENFEIVDVSAGLGSEGQLAGAAIDEADFIYVSSKGVHSLVTTDAYSDFEATYLSSKIQPTFKAFLKARIPFTQAVYIDTINSVAFSFSEDDGAAADSIWLYNVEQKEWYTWPDISAQALARILYNDTNTLFVGTADGRLIRTQIGTYTDFSTTGIRYRVKSGTIYPDANPLAIKAFKRITLFFRPVGTYSASVRVKIDGYSEQAAVFSQSSSGDALGVDFTLGTSTLGASSYFAPFTVPIDGYGHGMTLEIEQTGMAQQLAIYGYSIEWEAAGFSQETAGKE